ncbi:MAG: hypothetical protein ABIH03_00795 [Pseudomonadota bacterium]
MPYANVPPDKTDAMDKCVIDVMAQGKSKDSAIAICYTSIVEGQQHEQHYFEAKVTAQKAEGWEWEITIIGPDSPADVVMHEGKRYIKSGNGRLYSCDAIRDSVPMWTGVRAFDNHLTDDEFKERQGMRSVATEWIGTVTEAAWDAVNNRLVGKLRIVEESLAKKLKAAWAGGVLSSIGLSVDTFPKIRESVFEGKRTPLVEGFVHINSLDVVAEPAAGGRFTRLIASRQATNQTEVKDMELTPEMKELIRQEVMAALANQQTPEQDEQAITPEEAVAEVEQAAQVAAAQVADAAPADASPAEVAQDAADAIATAAQDAASQIEEPVMEAVRKLECKIMLRDKMDAAKLPDPLRNVVSKAFGGKVFKEAELDGFIKSVKEAQASLDPSGRVQGSGAQRSAVRVGMSPAEKFEMEFARLVMGESRFRAMESHQDPIVKERMTESWKSWISDGRPRYGTRKVSQLLYDFLGDPFTGDKARFTEGITTANMTTIVKNTVNLMVAADYSVKEEWWDPIVTIEEVDTIDDTTLARLYGYSNLSIVEEGQVYTELAAADEEETATFVKKGNYVAVTWETLYRDKLNYIRSIPTRLSNAWYNTLSALVSGVFTVNTATGPQLVDTGALFNASAVSGAGGHANLVTAATGALGFSSWGAAEIAMMKQTDQPLGAGRRLTTNIPKFALVPVDLKTTAQQIFNSENLPGSANNDINPFYQQAQVITVPDWTDTNNWAAVANKVEFPAIYLIFLRGNRVPQIFEASDDASGAMFTNDEMRFKVRLATYRFSPTYECAPVADFRPIYKANIA